MERIVYCRSCNRTAKIIAQEGESLVERLPDGSRWRHSIFDCDLTNLEPQGAAR
jgi:hypothetical protein